MNSLPEAAPRIFHINRDTTGTVNPGPLRLSSTGGTHTQEHMIKPEELAMGRHVNWGDIPDLEYVLDAYPVYSTPYN